MKMFISLDNLTIQGWSRDIWCSAQSMSTELTRPPEVCLQRKLKLLIPHRYIVYIHLQTYIRTPTHTYTHPHTHTHTHTHSHIHIHTHIHTYTHKHTHAFTYTHTLHTHAYTHANTHKIHTLTYTYNTHTYTQSCAREDVITFSGPKLVDRNKKRKKYFLVVSIFGAHNSWHAWIKRGKSRQSRRKHIFWLWAFRRPITTRLR